VASLRPAKRELAFAALARASSCYTRVGTTLTYESRAGNEFHLVSLYYEASQSSGRIRTGIDVDPVGANLRVLHRRVSVHNDFAEESPVMKKVVAYP